MELSSIELRYIVNLINSKIRDKSYYVSQITGITRESFLLKLHHSVNAEIFTMISTKGIWFTKMIFKQVEENDLVKSIKKELERARFLSIEQLGSERIIVLKFEHHQGNFRILICELFGNGNIILCDETMKIVSILNVLEVRHRTLRVGLKYSPPPSRGLDIFHISYSDIESNFNDENPELDVARWLGRLLSLPRKFIEEILYRAKIKSKKVKDLSKEDLLSVFNYTKYLVDEVLDEDKHNPIIILDEQQREEEQDLPVDASHIMLHNMSDLKTIRASSFVEALDNVLCNDIINTGKRLHTAEIDKKIAMLEHDLDEQNKAKQKVLFKSSTIRSLAQDLKYFSFLNQNELEDFLVKYSATLVLDKGKIYLSIVDEQIPLDTNLAKVSSLLYIRAKEMERGSETIDVAKLKIVNQINELKKQTHKLEEKVKVGTQKQKEWFERYRWFITSEGLLVIGGRDASSNSAIIRKYMTEQDIVFHAEIHGSPFFLIKNIVNSDSNVEESVKKDDGYYIENKDYLAKDNSNSSIIETAVATISFSRAWKDGLASADAYWVFSNQVKKGAPTGQYLPKGSFVIEGKRNYLKGLELKLAVGVMKQQNNTDNNNYYKIICGPIESIKANSVVNCTISPGNNEPMVIAKKIKSELIAKSVNNFDSAQPLVEFLKKLSIDDLIRVLPSGKTRIVS